MPDPTTTKSPAERLAELQKAKAARDEARASKAEALEVEFFELEAKFDTELGERGVEFEIVDARDVGERFLVVKRGEPVLHKRFLAVNEKKKKSGGADEADVFAYVVPCVVHPTIDEFKAICGRRPHLATRCANALATLFGVKKGDDEGKF